MTITAPEPITWLNEKQLSEHTGIAVGTLRTWRLKREVLPFTKLGALVRYDLALVNRVMKEREQQVSS